MLNDRIEKANDLLEALPYIKQFHGSTVVVKYGGSLMVEDVLKAQFAKDIVLLKYVGLNPVIVHGGGKEISKWMKRLGKTSEFIDGLRVTDESTMEITEMVLSGKINNELVSLLHQHEGKAVGISGKDAKLFVAKKIRSKSDQDIGSVGEITEVNKDIITTLNQGYIPVISSIAVDDKGETLNINADHAASKIAITLGAKKLVYLTDVDGVLTDGKLNSILSPHEAKELLAHHDVTGGMVPKLEYALQAADAGVTQVHIINGSVEHSVLLEIFTDSGIGTLISSKEKP